MLMLKLEPGLMSDETTVTWKRHCPYPGCAARVTFTGWAVSAGHTHRHSLYPVNGSPLRAEDARSLFFAVPGTSLHSWKAGICPVTSAKCCQSLLMIDVLSQANIGQMDTPKELWKMITGNMALIQVRKRRTKWKYGQLVQAQFQSLGFAIGCHYCTTDGEGNGTFLSHSHLPGQFAL